MLAGCTKKERFFTVAQGALSCYHKLRDGADMKNIDFFPTEYGVASLTISEIPYRQEAYIRVLDVQPENLDLLLQECAGFSRACGAEKIWWTGAQTEALPDLTVLRMTGTAWVDPDKLEQLFPVTEATVSRWRQIYNERMQAVPQARTLSFSDEQELTDACGTYFIHHRGELLGIGWLEDTHLKAIASVQRGAGERIVHTLMSLVEGEPMTLEVADTNEKAISLYRRLGFLPTGIASQWYLCEMTSKNT